MSYTVHINSKLGTGNDSKRQYNFDFSAASNHTGKFKIHTTFLSSTSAGVANEPIILKSNISNLAKTFSPDVNNGLPSDQILAVLKQTTNYNSIESQLENYMECNNTTNSPIIISSNLSTIFLDISFHTLDDELYDMVNDYIMTLFFEAI